MKEPALSEKVTDVDIEEHAIRIADDDANHKRKQVRNTLHKIQNSRQQV
jgi:uncharacterized protein (UPF0212 family)